MTPKTRRLPKPGEMLLSVHGSPLGVYKEDNMEAIHGMKRVSISALIHDLITASSIHACYIYHQEI
jgi:plasmid maintenance system antidote protein VapI